jgi:hypothetical protein
MKTVIDKIDAHPPHAFSPLELRAFLRLLPVELLRDIEVVRLSSAVEHSATQRVASFSKLERRLVIVSRSVTREVAMLEVMRCLIESNLRGPANYGRGSIPLSGSKIENIAQDLFAQVSPLMPVPPHWSRANLRYIKSKNPEANQALEPTLTAVTDRAGARSAPAVSVAHL